MENYLSKSDSVFAKNMRSPEKVMRLSRMGSSFQTRISFLRSLTRTIYREKWKIFVASKTLPIDLLRFKLAFFGASKFDPKSNLWTRITMFQGASLPGQFGTGFCEEMAYPLKPRTEAA